MQLHFLFSAVKEYLKFKLHGILKTEIYKNRQSVFKTKMNFYSGFLPAGELCFDVGANLGNRTEVFKALKCKVVAIEPQTMCFCYLKLRFGNSITLVKKGLSDKTGSIELHLSDSTTLSSISSDWIKKVKQTRFSGFRWDKKETIELTTLDELIKIHGTPHFIKIDVEGHELNVLKGLHKTPRMIAFEYTTPECSEALFECLTVLNSLDSNYVYNFSSGEQSSFALTKWMSYSEFSELLKNDINLLDGFGDIYAGLNSPK